MMIGICLQLEYLLWQEVSIVNLPLQRKSWICIMMDHLQPAPILRLFRQSCPMQPGVCSATPRLFAEDFEIVEALGEVIVAS